MKYGLTKLVMGAREYIELSEEQYEQIRVAHNSLFQLLYIEEKFDYVIENYYEYETELLSIQARHMVFNGQRDYFEGQTQRALVCRRIANLLTTCRLYVEHLIHHLRTIYGANHSNVTEVSKETRIQHSTHLGYRVMEALRDHVQHRGFPIHNLNNGSKMAPGSKVLYTISPRIKIASLKEDEVFKPKVLAELSEMGDEVEATPLIREYIEALGRVQDKIRTLTSEDVMNWEKTISDTIKLYKNTGDQKVTGLAIVAEGEDSTEVSRTNIFTDYNERRLKLIGKNSRLDNLASRYLTS